MLLDNFTNFTKKSLPVYLADGLKFDSARASGQNGGLTFLALEL
jgi:hypothetical protein